MTKNNTNESRFNKINEVARERKEKLTNLNADFRYKSKELKEKMAELEELNIPSSNIEELKTYVKEKEERLAFLLDNLEESLGLTENETAKTESFDNMMDNFKL